MVGYINHMARTTISPVKTAFHRSPLIKSSFISPEKVKEKSLNRHSMFVNLKTFFNFSNRNNHCIAKKSQKNLSQIKKSNIKPFYEIVIGSPEIPKLLF